MNTSLMDSPSIKKHIYAKRLRHLGDKKFDVGRTRTYAPEGN